MLKLAQKILRELAKKPLLKDKALILKDQDYFVASLLQDARHVYTYTHVVVQLGVQFYIYKDGVCVTSFVKPEASAGVEEVEDFVKVLNGHTPSSRSS